MSKHIIFNDDSDDNSIIDVTPSKETNKILPVSNLSHLKCSLVKIRHEQSFGFEIKGDLKKSGQHYLDCIDVGSAAHRAGLQCGDKIIKLNEVDVSNMNATSLISVMETNVAKNGRQLDVVVERTADRSYKGDIFTMNETYDMDTEESDDSQSYIGMAGLKKRLKTFSAMEKASTKTLSEKIKNNFNKRQLEKNDKNSETKKTNSTAQLLGPQVSKDFISLFTNPTPDPIYEQTRQDRIFSVTFISPCRPFRHQNVPSKLILNSKALELQRLISEQGRYVFWQEVIYELLQHYEACEHIGDLGLSQADQLHAISDLIRLQKRIDTFLISYESRTPCFTLLDIQQFIVDDYNYYISNSPGQSSCVKAEKFDDLCVGPLIKNQIVRRIFKLPDDIQSVEQMKCIKLGGVFKILESFLKENDLWAEKKVKQEEFEAYLVRKMKVKGLEMLGVKITSIAMLIGSVKNVSRFCSGTFRQIRDEVAEQLKHTLDQEKKYLLKYFTEKLISLRNKSSTTEALLSTQSALAYTSTPSIELVKTFLSLFIKLYDHTEFNQISPFMEMLQESDYLRDTFQLAICLGSHDLSSCLDQIQVNLNSDEEFEDEMAQYRKKLYSKMLKRVFFLLFDIKQATSKEIKRFLNSFLKEKDLRVVSSAYKVIPEEKQSYRTVQPPDYDKIDDQQSDCQILSETDEPPKKRPRHEYEDDNGGGYDKQEPVVKEALLCRLGELIRSRFEPFTNINLQNLVNLEADLGLGNSCFKFTELLSESRFLLEEELNVKMSLLAGDAELEESFEMERRREWIVGQIRQVVRSTNLIDKSSEEIMELVERCICRFYDVEAFEVLNIGKFEKLFSAANQKCSEVVNEGIVYIDSLLELAEINNNTENRWTTSADYNKLIQKITECPSLEDLGVYINWCGTTSELKTLIKNLNSKEIMTNNREMFRVDVLETRPGELLKLESSTGIEFLKKSIENSDVVKTCGHLVSILAVKYRQLLPESLIVNEIESSMTVLFLNCVDKKAFYLFLSEVILRVPVKLVERLVFRFLLGPASKVMNDGEVKTGVFKVLVEDVRISEVKVMDWRVRRMMEVGKRCGVQEWTIDSYYSIVKTKKELYLEEAKIAVSDDKVLKEEIKPEVSCLSEIANSEVGSDESSIGQEFEHVKSIRKRYGVGVDLDKKSKSVTDSLKGVIGRSLESLSNELYNKDMHFVLELIQNADDNSYEEGVLATLVFVVEDGRVTLFNNEVGFNERNVNAICDVKASTKGRHQRGYIGRKGIGFKSVFTVTNRPEIHSNNFHLSFDVTNGHIGYILPNWTPPSPSITALKSRVLNRFSALNIPISHLKTCIHLPLKSDSERQRHKSTLLTNNFNDIKPYLLLFLNRLRSLVIIQNNKERIYQRTDLSNNLIKISIITKELTTSHTWLVIKDSLKVPTNLYSSLDMPVDSTELCLAFPFLNNQTNNNQLPKMDVFAYLPLRSFGFTFIIQADFVVPASRQDITQDSDWNQWLIQQIPHLFVRSFKHFKPCLEDSTSFESKLNALKTYMRFIPLKEEIVGFFQNVPDQIAELLRQEEILPVMWADSVVWKRPFECIVVQGMDESVQQVLTSELLKDHLGRYYVHPDLFKDDGINLKVLVKLGVRILDVEDIVEVMKSVLGTENQLKENTARWLIILHDCLKRIYSTRQQDAIIHQIKQIKFIPVMTNGQSSELVSISTLSRAIFFSQKTTQEYITSSSNSIENTQAMLNAAMMIEADMSIVDSEVLLSYDPNKNAQIISVLRLLGVSSFVPKEVIERHIYPVLSKRESKSEITIVNFVIYLYECWQLNPDQVIHLLEKLKGQVPLKTNKGFICVDKSGKQPIYLTPQYGNKTQIQRKFSSYPHWCFIDECYLESSVKTREAMLGWRRFLISLGCSDKFMPLAYENLVDSDRVIVDYICPVFEFYAACAVDFDPESGVGEELKSLYCFIEKNWEILSKFKFKKVASVDLAEVSSYYSSLKNSKWILAESVRYKSVAGNVEEVKSLIMECPYKVYVKEAVFVRYFGNLVPYAIEKTSIKSGLSKELGLKIEFSVDDFVRVISEWCEASTGNDVYASVGQMKNIYTLLFGNYLNSYEIKEDLRFKISSMISKRVIFIPSGSMVKNGLDEVSSGRFISVLDNVFWHDPTGIFEKYCQVFHMIKTAPILLEPLYSSDKENSRLKEVFTDNLKVPKTPCLADYVNLLEHVALLASADKTSFSSQEVLEQVYSLYEMIVDKCIEMTVEGEPLVDNETRVLNRDFSNIVVGSRVKNILVDMVKFKWIIPCFKNKWISLMNQNEDRVTYNHPLITDNIEIAEKFMKKLHMLQTTESDSFVASTSTSQLSNKHIYFLSGLLGLDLFSNTITIDLQFNLDNTNLTESADNKNICRQILPYIQTFLFHKHEFKPIYIRLSQINVHSELERLKFYAVDDLDNVYRSCNDPMLYVTIANRTCFDRTRSGKWMYICRRDASEKEVIKGFVRMLLDCEEKEVTRFCILMWQLCKGRSMLPEEDKREIERDYGIKLDVPLGEMRWAIKGVDQGMSAVDKSINKRLKNSNRSEIFYEDISRAQINVPEVDVAGLSEKLREAFEVKQRKETVVENSEVRGEKQLNARMSLNNFVSNLDGNKTTRMLDYINQIGRWGEIWVNEMLKKKSVQEKNHIQIEWVNETGESGLPFDFKVVQGDRVDFIEVKSTVRANQESFPISYNELMFAQDNPDNFYIYRLYNAGVDDPTKVELKIISQIPKLLNTHGLSLFIVI